MGDLCDPIEQKVDSRAERVLPGAQKTQVAQINLHISGSCCVQLKLHVLSEDYDKKLLLSYCSVHELTECGLCAGTLCLRRQSCIFWLPCESVLTH